MQVWRAVTDDSATLYALTPTPFGVNDEQETKNFISLANHDRFGLGYFSGFLPQYSSFR